MSYTSYRVVHTRHHRYLGNPRDPDYNENNSGRRGLVWFMQNMRMTINALVDIFMIPFLAWQYGSSTERRDILVEYSLLLPPYALLIATFPSDILFYSWFAPLLLTGWMPAIRVLRQHGITDPYDPYIARHSIDASCPVRFFVFKKNYHLEHHLFPEIPSHHLAVAHPLISLCPPRKVTMKSYLGFLFRFFAQSLRMDNTSIGVDSTSGA